VKLPIVSGLELGLEPVVIGIIFLNWTQNRFLDSFLSVEMERNWKIVVIYYLELELEVLHYKERTCPTPV
jgi:hypothetical protein